MAADSSIAVSDALTRFISEYRWEDIPAHVRHEAKRSLLNYFAVALSACHDPTIEIAARTYRHFAAGKQATVIGRRERTDILNAAALNCMGANVFDFDDTHIPTIIHPTAPVAPAVFALAETMATRGVDFLLAFILGVETECRIGNAISPGHYARGWHITSTCGVFGSAMAAGKLLGLSRQQLVWALGTASAQASGLVETLGTMAKSVSMGNAARNGILSALLAREGFEVELLPVDAEGRVTEFFLVPYYGACIHVPPPAPNQMLFVSYPKGLTLASMYAAYWVSGRISTHTRQSKLGSAAYALAATGVEEYRY